MLKRLAEKLAPLRVSGEWPKIYKFLAPLLVLLTPFLIFLRFNSYGYLSLDVLIIIVGISVASGAFFVTSVFGGQISRILVISFLVVLFVDFQFDFKDSKLLFSVFAASGVFAWFLRESSSQVLTVVFATILVSAELLPAGGEGDDPAAGGPEIAVRPELPSVVHLILDEHIGVEGIPMDVPGGPEIKQFIKSFYLENGFRLYGKAFSEYYRSLDSLSVVVNYDTNRFESRLNRAVGQGYELLKNDYFLAMRKVGYKINVYQTDYLNFCTDPRVDDTACFTYNYRGIKALRDLPFTELEKVWIIASMYLRRSIIHAEVRKLYELFRGIAAPHGWRLPKWDWNRIHVGPVPVLSVIERLIADLSASPGGTLYFAHLLLPHTPFIYDAACNLRPVADWMDRADGGGTPPFNTSETRQARYERYFEQLRCLYEKMDLILDKIEKNNKLKNAIIIVHGDHGSRIIFSRPWEEDEDILRRSDYIDSYSTLFAIRSNGIAAGYDRNLTSMQALFAKLAASRFRRLPVSGAAAKSPIYLWRRGSGWIVRRPMIDFDAVAGVD